MTSNDHLDVWVPLEVAADAIDRQPRLLRKWIARGMPHMMHKHRLYVKHITAVQWSVKNPKRAPRTGGDDAA